MLKQARFPFLNLFKLNQTNLNCYRSLLTVGSRLVISHIHGSEFVKAEKDGNKHLNISIMPSYNEISHICESVGFRPLPPTTNLEDFYLIILEAI